MKLIKEFNLFNEKEFEEIRLPRIAFNTTVREIYDFFDKIINKEIEFYDYKSNSKMIKIRLSDYKFIFFKDNEYGIKFISDEKQEYPFDMNRPIRVSIKRTYSKDDPYGEEDWIEQ